MEIRKMTPLFAAELSGVDIANADDPELIELVEDLMREHAVLCIRGQGHIDDERHLAFARAFGPLELPRRNGIPQRISFGLYDASNLDENNEIVSSQSMRALSCTNSSCSEAWFSGCST